MSSLKKVQEAEDALKLLEARLPETMKKHAEITENMKKHEDWLLNHKPPIELLDPIRKVELENRGKPTMDCKPLDPEIEVKVRAYKEEWENHTNILQSLRNTRTPIGLSIGTTKRQIENQTLKVRRLKIEDIPALRQFMEKRVKEHGARLIRKREGNG